MATAPESVRVVLGAARTFSEIALDALREAVLLIDIRRHHKPVLLANAAAGRFFVHGAAAAPLTDSCLYEWLRPAEAEAVEATIAGLSRHPQGASRIVTWRSAAGETPVMTDFKLIDADAGERVVMLILDRNLKITYANAAAVRSSQFTAAREPCGLVGVTQDITASRQSEVRLRRGEELLRATTENAADTLLLLDADLTIRFINRELRGMTVDELSGSPIERLVPVAERERVSAKLRQVLASGEAMSFEFEDFGAAETQHFENRAVLVAGHGLAGISLSVRNITERKRLEREILEVSGRERQRIGRDLHDGLGQELTGIALMMRGLARRLERECPEAVESTNEIVALVNQSIDSTRCLARGLLPVSIEQGGLLAALRGLADRSRGRHGLDVQFSAESWPELALDETRASHLYRIAQEALTNATRHARGSLVEIGLMVGEHQFRLKIADNGCGLPDSAAAATGLGMNIMAYRANIIGAKFEILRNPGGGTIVQVTGSQP